MKLVHELFENAAPIFENYVQSVIITDKEGTIIYWNPKAEEIYGWKKAEVEGKKILEIIKSATDTTIHTEILDHLGLGYDHNDHLKVITKEGKEIIISSITSPIYDSSGEIRGFIGISSDVTEKILKEEMNYFLTQASKELSSTLNSETTLNNITKLITPKLADWFVIDLYNKEKHSFDIYLLAHKDPEKIKWGYNLRKEWPVDMESPTGGPNVWRTGNPELYSYIPLEMLEQAAKNEEQLKVIKEIGYHSVMIVPLSTGNEVLGVITFVSTKESKREYTQSDLEIAQDFAKRVALTIENVRLFNEAQNTRERLDNLLSTIPGIVWETTGLLYEKTQRVMYVNDYVEELLGYTPEEWMNTPNIGEKIMHPDERERILTDLAKIVETANKGSLQYKAITKSGEVKSLESNFVVMRDNTGKVTGMRGVLTDITTSKELELKKDEFLSIASHELKTPLTSIKGYIQLLGSLESDPTIVNYLDKVNVQVNNLNNIITDLLDLSKIQAGKLEYKFEQVNLLDLVNESISNISHGTLGHNIIVNSNGAVNIQGDAYRLEQVINNLLSNAIKYSPEGSDVILSLSITNNKALLTVQDFGIGIPKIHQKQVFNKFYRVNDINDTTTGLGMGLYITSEIIKRHLGNIEVQSDEGKGTTFLVELPLSGK